MSEEKLLEVENLTKHYLQGYVSTSVVVGAEDVTFDLSGSKVYGLVGESGSGKTTVGDMILRLIEPTSGEIRLHGKDAFSYDKKDYWGKVQTVFQDPFSSFNFFYTVDKPLKEAFDLLDEDYSDEEKEEVIEETLDTIGMNPEETMGRYPHQLSGGQMQRLLIARSFIIHPDLLIADELTSMIDASTRVSVLNELQRLQEMEDLSVLFITHDLAQAYFISDYIAIMKEGRIVEQGPAENVVFDPTEEYTKNLVESVPPLYEKWDVE